MRFATGGGDMSVGSTIAAGCERESERCPQHRQL